MGLHEIKNLCTTKETVSKLKRPHTEWEKIFASYALDKGLRTRIYRELKKLNSQKINDLMSKNVSQEVKVHMDTSHEHNDNVQMLS
jgi:hypothetical protein